MQRFNTHNCNWLIYGLLLLLLGLQTAQAQDPAGRLMFVHGQVWIERDGQGQRAERGADIFVGDTLVTEAASSAQIRFTDGGTNALRPNTRYTLRDYENDQANPDNSRKSAELFRGGLRSISGTISRSAPENVNYDTPVATMGIRGTSFQAIHNDDGTYLLVESGLVALQSEVGLRLVQPGQAFQVERRDALPVQVPADLPVFAEDEDATPAPETGDSPAEQVSNNEPGAPSEMPIADGPQVDFDITLLHADLQLEAPELVEDPQREQELQCQEQGFASCEALSEHLEAEAACQEEGFGSCVARNEFFAAEVACQAQGFASCAAREQYFAAEQACRAQGFTSCLARDVFYMRESACRNEGYDSCADKKEQLAIEQQRKESCSGLGFASCDEMLGDLEGYYLETSPLAATGSTQVMIGNQIYELAGDQAQWLESEGIPVLGAFSNPTQVRLQTPKHATPSFSDALPASEHSGTTSFYWGVWSDNNFELLDPETLEPLDQETNDLHYMAASHMISGSAAEALTSLQATLGAPVRFYIAGATPITTTDTSFMEVDPVHSFIEFDESWGAENIFVSLEISHQVIDLPTGEYVSGGRVALESLTSTQGTSFPVYSLSELMDADCIEFDCAISPATAGESTFWFSLTGDTAVDGALSRLGIQLGDGVSGTSGYGTLAWLVDPVAPVDPVQETLNVGEHGFILADSNVDIIFGFDIESVLLVDGIPQAVYLVDTGGGLELANLGAAGAFGGSKTLVDINDEVIGTAFWGVWSQDAYAVLPDTEHFEDYEAPVFAYIASDLDANHGFPMSPVRFELDTSSVVLVDTNNPGTNLGIASGSLLLDLQSPMSMSTLELELLGGELTAMGEGFLFGHFTEWTGPGDMEGEIDMFPVGPNMEYLLAVFDLALMDSGTTNYLGTGVFEQDFEFFKVVDGGLTSFYQPWRQMLGVELMDGEAVTAVHLQGDWRVLLDSGGSPYAGQGRTAEIEDADGQISSNVYWGYWQAGSYFHQGMDMFPADPQEEFYFGIAEQLYSNDLVLFEAEHIEFHLVGEGILPSTDTDPLHYLRVSDGVLSITEVSGNLEINASLTFFDPTGSITSNLQGGANIASIDRLSSFPELSLTPGASPASGSIEAAAITESLFIGENSVDGLLSIIEAIREGDEAVFKGPAVFQRDY